MIAYTVLLFIAVSLIDLRHCAMLAECGFVGGDFLKKLSEKGGKALYLPLVSVFCFLAAFVLWEISLIAAVLLTAAGVALCAVYCIMGGWCRYSRLSLFIVCEAISLLLCILGYLTGGGILCMLPILSVFSALAGNAIRLKAGQGRRLSRYERRGESLSGAHRVLVLTSPQVRADVAAVLERLTEKEEGFDVYRDVRAELLYRDMPQKSDNMIFCADIHCAAETQGLLRLISPQYLLVLGAKGRADKRLIRELSRCEAVYTDDAELSDGNNIIDVRELDCVDGDLSPEEKSILAACADILVRLGVSGQSVRQRAGLLLIRVEK